MCDVEPVRVAGPAPTRMVGTSCGSMPEPGGAWMIMVVPGRAYGASAATDRLVSAGPAGVAVQADHEEAGTDGLQREPEPGRALVHDDDLARPRPVRGGVYLRRHTAGEAVRSLSRRRA